MFFVWFSANMNVLGYAYQLAQSIRNLTKDVFRLGTGAAGPAFFGLGVKQALIIVTIVDIMYVLTMTHISQLLTYYSACAIPASL